MLYIIRVFLFCILTFSSSLLFGQNKFYINDLIEINNQFYSKATRNMIQGKIFKRFNNNSLKEVYLGLITSNGKHGSWTRWWDNGKKKIEGNYNHNKKHGFWTQWDINGVKFYETVYKRGQLVQLKNCILEKCDSTLNKKEFISP